MSEKQNKPPGFSLKEKENHYLIPYKEILYISSHSRTSVVHTKSRDYAVNLLLKEIENKLHQPILDHKLYPKPIVEHEKQKEKALSLYHQPHIL